MAQATHEQPVTPSSNPFTQPARKGDHEALFRLLEEVGPAPEEFMLNVTDPFIESEPFFGWEEEA